MQVDGVEGGRQGDGGILGSGKCPGHHCSRRWRSPLYTLAELGSSGLDRHRPGAENG
jgi:hypothetical protein